MNASVLSLWRVRALAIALALVGACALFFTMTSDALAANTISTKNYEDSGTADGTVDRVRWVIDENVVACTYESGDWTVNTAGVINITAITAVACTTTDANLDITVTTTANTTGASGGAEPVISYANTGQPNSIFLTSGAMTAKTSQTLTDGAKPQINTFVYQDNDGDGKIDRFNITFSESVVAASVVRPNDFTLSNVGDFTAAAFGADTTDAVAGTVSSAAVTLGTESTAQDTGEGSGNIAISTQNGFRLDDAASNSNTTLGAQAAIATFVDGASPKIATLTYSDADADGKIDTVVAAYTESVVAASIISNNDMTLSAVGDFTTLAFGSTSTDLITGTVSSTTFTLGTESTVQDTEDNAGTFAISTQNAFRLDDSVSNSNTTTGAQASIATIVDGAKAVIKAFDYQDVDDDGKIDTIVANFTEEVVAGSVLRPNDLTLTGVGDFTAAAFGSDTTDAISGTVTSATLTLGTESTAKDTAEGAGTIAISSQNGFSLVDTASSPNTNSTLGAQSASASFVDEAAPQIATVTYSDADADAKVDTLALGYTESVAAGSVLRHADLTLTGVGDLTALAFGAATTDLITGTVTSTTITMGTESSAEDTNDAAGTLAMTSQANFSLVDTSAAANTNAELEAQMSSSATAVDGAAPMLLTTTPASAATGQSRSRTIVLNWSEPISTGSFAWTKTNGPATTSFSSVWTASNATLTLTPLGLLSSGAHTVTVTAAPDPTSNTFGGAVAAIANPFTFTVVGGSTTSSGASSTEASYDLDVTAPNGGESLTPGEMTNITWTSSATNGSMTAVNINLIYGDGSSTTQETIATNDSNDGVYAWTVPDIDSDYAMIQVVGTDLATALATDESDAYFMIGSGTSSDDAEDTEEETSDEVTAPSSGETGYSPVTGEEEEISTVEAGQYIRSSYFDTVYYLEEGDAGELVRRPFMDAQTFMTWQDDWDDVETVTDATLPTLELGLPMLPKAGVVLVKITTVAKVYAVEGDGTLRWITDEDVAIDTYGADWADYVIDIADTLFPRFDMGDDIDSAEDVDTSGMKTRQEVNS